MVGTYRLCLALHRVQHLLDRILRHLGREQSALQHYYSRHKPAGRGGYHHLHPRGISVQPAL